MAPYDRPLGKIKRARSLIDEIKREEKLFYDNGHYRIIVIDEPQVGIRHFNTIMAEDLGEVFAPIAGDAAHNIRSALDLVAYEIVFPLLQPGDNKEGVKFPFEKNTTLHDSFFQKRPMWRTPAAVSKKMSEVSHPATGDKEIRALHHLDIRDKHHDGLFVVYSTHLTSFSARDFDPQAMNFVLRDSGGVVTRGIFSGVPAPLNARSLPQAIVQAKIDKHMRDALTFQVQFSGKEALFAGEPVSDVLLRIAARVETLIAELREAAKMKP